MAYALPIAYALFLWWFCTGLIFYLDSLPARTFRWSMLGASAVLATALGAIWWLRGDTGIVATYLAFTAAVLAWGFQEISLYMGYITGPRKHRCQAGCSGWRHFRHAIEVNLWHELSIIAVALVIAWLVWDSQNLVAMWTYLLLWMMNLSARLNVFLGVRNVSEEFVPARMEVLKSFLNRKPMNLLFPVSVTAATIGAVLLFLSAASAYTAHDVTSLSFLGAMMTLALVEHWFLMLPLPVEKLFRWTLAVQHGPRRPAHATASEAVELKLVKTTP
jgi:putative photosynthetic complex assembly protein 2